VRFSTKVWPIANVAELLVGKRPRRLARGEQYRDEIFANEVGSMTVEAVVTNEHQSPHVSVLSGSVVGVTPAHDDAKSRLSHGGRQFSSCIRR